MNFAYFSTILVIDFQHAPRSNSTNNRSNIPFVLLSLIKGELPDQFSPGLMSLMGEFLILHKITLPGAPEPVTVKSCSLQRQWRRRWRGVADQPGGKYRQWLAVSYGNHQVFKKNTGHTHTHVYYIYIYISDCFSICQHVRPISTYFM